MRRHIVIHISVLFKRGFKSEVLRTFCRDLCRLPIQVFCLESSFLCNPLWVHSLPCLHYKFMFFLVRAPDSLSHRTPVVLPFLLPRPGPPWPLEGTASAELPAARLRTNLGRREPRIGPGAPPFHAARRPRARLSERLRV